MKTLISVDPGFSGSIAWIQPGNGSAQAIPMPETRGDTIAAIRKIITEARFTPVAYVEKITGFIPDGGASQMFQFGAAVERVGCILETLGVRVIEITPQAWQKALGLGKSDRQRATKDATPEQRKAIKAHNARAKTEWKNKLKAECQRRFPHLTITLKTADSLLLLEVAQQMEGVKPPHMELESTIEPARPRHRVIPYFPPQEATSPFDA